MWPFDELGGIFDDSFTFQEIKPFEAQGEFREVSLILIYASSLLMDTLTIINFLVFLGVDYFKEALHNSRFFPMAL